MNRKFKKLLISSVYPMLFLLALVGASYFTANQFGLFNEIDPNAGKVPTYVSRAPISAYTQVKKEHLDIVYLPRVPEVAITDAKGIIGRVLSRDKSAGYVFTEGDFLPQGTKPGLVAGIPPGKRAFTCAVVF